MLQIIYQYVVKYYEHCVHFFIISNSNMLHTHTQFKRLGPRVINYTVYHKIQNTLLRYMTSNLTSLIDTRKNACPLNVVKHIFLLILFVPLC